MNQTEIDELRRLHEADSAKIINAMANIDWQQHLLNGGGCFHVEDDGRLCGRADRWAGHSEPDFHMFVPLYVAATKIAKSNALPRLLIALEEARAERDRARQKIQAMEEQAMADEDCMSMRPLDGRLRKVEAERDALKAKLADAEAERGEARSLLLNGIQTNGDSLAFLEHVRREHAAVVADRDALNAKLAHAEAESAGYQKLAQACKDKDGKTVVVIIRGESEVRVFGPNPDCEERFGEVVVRWWKLLDTVVESKAFDALKAERDALKATQAKHAESERAWCELATARGAKLAALEDYLRNEIATSSKAVPSTADEAIGDAERVLFCQQLLSHEALAAAKVQP